MFENPKFIQCIDVKLKLIYILTSLLTILEVLILFNPNPQIIDILAALNLFILSLLVIKRKSWFECHQKFFEILMLVAYVVLLVRIFAMNRTF